MSTSRRNNGTNGKGRREVCSYIRVELTSGFPFERSFRGGAGGGRLNTPSSGKFAPFLRQLRWLRRGRRGLGRWHRCVRGRDARSSRHGPGRRECQALCWLRGKSRCLSRKP